jgi:hypothetical protein
LPFGRQNISVGNTPLKKTVCAARFIPLHPAGRVSVKCHAKVDEWLDDGIYDGGKRVSDMFDRWIEELKLTTGRSHWDQYEGYMDGITLSQ